MENAVKTRLSGGGGKLIPTPNKGLKTKNQPNVHVWLIFIMQKVGNYK